MWLTFCCQTSVQIFRCDGSLSFLLEVCDVLSFGTNMCGVKFGKRVWYIKQILNSCGYCERDGNLFPYIKQEIGSNIINNVRFDLIRNVDRLNRVKVEGDIKIYHFSDSRMNARSHQFQLVSCPFSHCFQFALCVPEKPTSKFIYEFVYLTCFISYFLDCWWTSGTRCNLNGLPHHSFAQERA